MPLLLERLLSADSCDKAGLHDADLARPALEQPPLLLQPRRSGLPGGGLYSSRRGCRPAGSAGALLAAPAATAPAAAGLALAEPRLLTALLLAGDASAQALRLHLGLTDRVKVSMRGEPELLPDWRPGEACMGASIQ